MNAILSSLQNLAADKDNAPLVERIHDLCEEVIKESWDKIERSGGEQAAATRNIPQPQTKRDAMYQAAGTLQLALFLKGATTSTENDADEADDPNASQNTIGWLQDRIHKLNLLLSHPEPGLFTWAEAYHNAMTELSEFWTGGWRNVKNKHYNK